MSEVDEIKRALMRERAARKEAERILEEKSRELFEKDQQIWELLQDQRIQLETLIGDVYKRQRELNALFEEHPFPLIIYCAETLKILDVNRTAVDFYGYSKENLLGFRITDLHTADEVEMVSRHIADSNSGSTGKEWKHVLSNGEVRNTRITGTATYFKGKEARLIIVEDITKKKLLDSALRRSEEKYRSIIQNMNLGLVEVNKEGIIVKAYDSFCRIVGYQPEELEGTDGTFLLDKNGRERLQFELNQRRLGNTGTFEVPLIAKNGDPKWVVVSGAPYYDENNNIVGSVGIHLEINEHKQLQAELTQARDAAEASLKAKELFLANISHEIKTPLNAIVGIGELLGETELTGLQAGYLDSINAASGQLMGIINDLLLLAQEKVGEIRLVMEPYDLREVIEETYEFMRVSIEEKNIDYVLELDDRLQTYLFDRVRLSQILQNLLSNAIKFTDKGEVKICAKLLGQTNVSDLIEICVEDSGIGIPKEEQERVFESFSQASNNSPELHGGTGLGLYIVHNLVEKMGGEMEFQSSSDGTRFAIRLQLRKAKKAPEEIAEPKLVSFKGTSILIAEDNRVNQLVVQTILEKTGADVTIVGNGKEVLKQLASRHFDLILMDIRMPEMDGLETTKRLKEHPEYAKIPVIALTANNVDSLNQMYLQAGMRDVIDKPFRSDRLYSVLEKYLQPAENVKSAAQERALEVADGDAEMAQSFLEIFCEETEKRLARLRQLDSRSHRSEIENICHSMKPSLQQIAGDALYGMARSLENDGLPEEQFNAKFDVFQLEIEELLEALK